MKSDQPAKKILFVSYTFYPDNNPRTLRWQSLGVELVRAGYEFHIVTNQKAENPPFQIFGRKKSQNVSAQEVKAVKQKVSLTKKVIQRIRKVFKLFIWPDFSAAWIPWALFKIFSLSRKNHYDLIISSSHPMSAHLPVLLLKKWGLLDKSLWTVDIGDPFGLIGFHNLNNQFLYEGLNHLFEKSVCHTADVVSVTTKQTKALYIDGYGLSPDKIQIAPPVLSIDLQKKTGQINPYQENTYNFVFAGTLYKAIRSPKVVLEFAEFLQTKSPNKYQFHFFGVLGDCAGDFLKTSENVKTYGLVNREVLAPYFTYSDAMINIGNNSQYQLPSKIIEAVGSGQFIFNFCDVQGDTSSEFLDQYPGNYNLHTNAQFSEALSKFENSLLNKEKIQEASKAIIKNHTPSVVAELFLRH